MISMWAVLKICWFESKARPDSSLSMRSGRSCARACHFFVKTREGIAETNLHDGLELDVAVGALPARHEVEHVDAGGGPAVLDALAAGQLHADGREEREARDLVAHPEEACVEIDLRGQRGDGDQARVPDEQQGRHGLVEEARLDVGRLLQHDEVPARALGGRDLRAKGCGWLEAPEKGDTFSRGVFFWRGWLVIYT